MHRSPLLYFLPIAICTTLAHLPRAGAADATTGWDMLVNPAAHTRLESTQPADDGHGDSDDDGERKPYTLSILQNNDGGILKRNNPSDGHYTNGTAVSLTHQPDWAHDLAKKIYRGQHDRTEHHASAGFIVGQLMFTPEDITTRRLIEDDRPYAGYLFAGAFWQRSDARTLDHARVELGVVGPASHASDIQQWIHDVYGGDEPRGWDHQLDDEVTGQGYYRRKWRFSSDPVNLGGLAIEAELLPDAGLALGTVYRHVEAGTTLRLGHKLPRGFGPARLDDLSGTAETLQEGFGAYGFVRLSGRAVEHNLFLEGNTFEDSHAVEEERFVGRFKTGVRAYYRRGRWSAQVGYDQTFLTPEFVEQADGDAYASLIVMLTGRF